MSNVAEETAVDQIEETDAVADARLAETEATLNQIGSEASTESRAIGRQLVSVDNGCKTLARLCLQARNAIWKKVRVETENGMQMQPVRDLDGKSDVYRKWYDQYIMAVLREQTPVEVFTVTDGNAESGEREIAIPDADWVTKTQRSIQYYVAQGLREFVAEHGLEHDVQLLGLDTTPPSEKQRKRYEQRQGQQQGDSGEDGVPAATRQLETLIKKNEGDAVLKAGWITDLALDLSELVNDEFVKGLTTEDRKRVGQSITRANVELDKIIQRLDSAPPYVAPATETETETPAS